MSPWHWAIVIGVALLLFGARRLPDAARSLGRSARILRAEMQTGSSDAAATPTTPSTPDAPAAPDAPATATANAPTTPSTPAPSAPTPSATEPGSAGRGSSPTP